MTTLNNKIDFIALVEVRNANPNGDPLAGNYPRTDSRGYGVMSDVSIKRKVRNRLQDLGESIFVQSSDRATDDYKSLNQRYNAVFDTEKDLDKIYEDACRRWLDVRTFGQVFTYNKLSLGIRGPVSISMAKSLSPVESVSMQITRSANSMDPKEGKSRSSDTIGSKQYIDFGVYLIKGSINPYFAEKTGFSEEDVESVKESIRTLFVNDASSARPEGSMTIRDIFWFTHPDTLGQISSGKIFDMLQYNNLTTLEVENYEDYEIKLNEEGVKQLEEKGVEIEHFQGL